MSDLLNQIMLVSGQLIEKQKALRETEELVEEIKAHVENLSKRVLPDLMTSVGLTEVVVKGTKITIKPDVVGNVPKDRMDAVAEWLDANNAGAIMKRELRVNFDKKEQLIASNTPFTENNSIHHSTLQAFVREQVENNPNFPRELFGVHEGSKAVTKTV